MDIFIKSFNRPYYLERCIRSLQQNISGKHTVTVLDDGTSEIYLEKIKKTFPFVKILGSSDSGRKRNAIERHLQQKENYCITTIPSTFWCDAIGSASEMFLLMEEDSWLTSPVNVEEATALFANPKVMTIKLGWNGNDGIVRGEKQELTPSFEEIRPSLPIENRAILFPLLRNVFRTRSILIRSGLMSADFLTPYYGLYTVCSAFFRREYWLQMWKDAEDHVDETRQLERALNWRATYPESIYGKSKSEVIRTSFITSAIATRHRPYFDMIRLNHHLSQCWLRNELDVSENMPRDFTVEYLERIVSWQAIGSAFTQSDWRRWIEAFKDDHRRVGCRVV